MNKNEIKALISLLEDPDHNIYFQVKNKLIEFGIEVIPDLEDAWEMNFDSLMQRRTEQIIHEIQLNFNLKELNDWVESPEKDLLKAWIIISRYQYPDLDTKNIELQIEQLINEIWIELNNNLTGLEKIKLINHIIFEVHKYKGSIRNFYAPQNSYVNDVLNNKKGSPLSLSLLFLIIAQKCELPVRGVNLPKHFIIAYINEELCAGDPIKFYINPFSQGTILSRQDLERFLEREKLELKTMFFSPCGNKTIIGRLLANLLQSYSKNGNKEKAEEIQSFIQLFKNK